MLKASFGRDVERDDFFDSAVPHPEEMKASVDFTVGDNVVFRARARATPAGLVATALLAAAVIVPAVWLLTSARRGRP